MSKLPYINLGCGITFHAGWTNIDFVSTGEGVQAHDLNKGIPCRDAEFEVVYHSHILEHFPRERAKVFNRECFRVLKKGGILRVAVPDLEQIALNYIKYLNESVQGVPGAGEKYEWTVLEMYDQVTRNVSGGQMLDYIKDESKNNDAFLLQRNGKEVQRIMDTFRLKQSNKSSEQEEVPDIRTRLYRFRKNLLSSGKSMLNADDQRALEIGRFRMMGEIHQWMYDRYSLKILMEQTGFSNCQVRGAFDSSIKNWKDFGLDGDAATGQVRKPDSLFMEGIK